MDLAELTRQIDVIDVLVALITGFIAWMSVNKIGQRLILRNLGAETHEGRPRWSYAFAQGTLRLVANLSGIATGFFIIWLIAK